MAKNRNKKKKDGSAPMEITSGTHDDDMKVDGNSESEVSFLKPALGAVNRKLKKTAPTRRSKVVRKMKALEKAISKNEKTEERVSKHKNKMSRIRSAKTLYE